jgi:hypothetical protein
LLALAPPSRLETFHHDGRGGGIVQGKGAMGTRDADWNNESGGRLARAWRWLQSPGFAEDDALYGPPRQDLDKERFVLAVLTQAVFWRTNR